MKIRGVRIELAEIEAHLKQHPAVQQAVVVVYTPPERDPQLVAYWASESTKSFSDEVLQQFLAQKLPPYMLPSFIIHLETLPKHPMAN